MTYLAQPTRCYMVAGPSTFTLPSARLFRRVQVCVKKSDSGKGKVSLATTPPDTIDSPPGTLDKQHQCALFYSNGVQWLYVGEV